MNQTSVIFGALLVGFIVYITVKGRLPAYAAVLFTTASKNTATGGQPSNMTGLPTLGNPGSYGGGQMTPSGFDWQETLKTYSDSHPLGIY